MDAVYSGGSNAATGRRSDENYGVDFIFLNETLDGRFMKVGDVRRIANDAIGIVREFWMYPGPFLSSSAQIDGNFCPTIVN